MTSSWCRFILLYPTAQLIREIVISKQRWWRTAEVTDEVKAWPRLRPGRSVSSRRPPSSSLLKSPTDVQVSCHDLKSFRVAIENDQTGNLWHLILKSHILIVHVEMKQMNTFSRWSRNISPCKVFKRKCFPPCYVGNPDCSSLNPQRLFSTALPVHLKAEGGKNQVELKWDWGGDTSDCPLFGRRRLSTEKRTFRITRTHSGSYQSLLVRNIGRYTFKLMDSLLCCVY